jgi:hypothetical protein
MPIDRNQFRRRNQHELESTWLSEHQNEFAGKWIALEGETLLAAGDSAKAVFASVAHHKPAPLIIHIAEPEMPFAGW